jgi:uncharacterized protein (TIGR02996 family)
MSSGEVKGAEVAMNEDAFLSALREDPADEVTWLALSDWLDDNGQPERAELLRLTRQLRGEGRAKRAKAQRRVGELLSAGVRPVVAEVTNGVGMRLALVPAGAFRMGAARTEDDYDNDELAHRVEISRPFYLGVFPVTQAQYEKVMGENVASFCERGRNRAKVTGLDTGDFPVDQTTWDEAALFCERLSAAEPNRHYRLPTEAEWEYACRAGMNTAYCYGDRINLKLANYDGRRADGRVLARPCKVGSYRPNAFGLYDLHGQVMEWCSDYYERGYYRHSPERDPVGPFTGQYRVARGGCWYFPASAIRSASRNFFSAHAQDSCVGFRVAMRPPG